MNPTSNGVVHQKWWGWGQEGVAFSHSNKPNFAPFVLANIGLDLSVPGTPPPAFEDVDVPASRLDAGGELARVLREAVGEEAFVVDDLVRVVHTHGKGLADLVKVRRGELPRVPDVVLYPADEDAVRAIVDATISYDAVLIPFGGGSNISGSLTPPAHEDRVVISLDLGRMNRVLEIDEESGLARIQAGVLGPDMEDQLKTAAGRRATSRTPSSTPPSAGGSPRAPRACSPTGTATSPTSPVACAWSNPGRWSSCGPCRRRPRARACAR